MALAMPLRGGMSAALAAEVMQLSLSRREGIRLRRLTETCNDRVPVDVGTADFEVFCVADAMVGEAPLPDGELGGVTVGEASLDEPDRAFEGDGMRGDKKVNVVGHDDKRMEFVVTFGSVN
jgi:hypothetical protein